MKVITGSVSKAELVELAKHIFGNMIKAVVDIEQEIMAVDAELHADEEALLIEQGSKQQDLWGINLYPELPGEQLIEFDSLINLKPAQNNRSRGVDDPAIRVRISAVVNKLVKP